MKLLSKLLGNMVAVVLLLGATLNPWAARADNWPDTWGTITGMCLGPNSCLGCDWTLRPTTNTEALRITHCTSEYYLRTGDKATVWRAGLPANLGSATCLHFYGYSQGSATITNYGVVAPNAIWTTFGVSAPCGHGSPPELALTPLSAGISSIFHTPPTTPLLFLTWPTDITNYTHAIIHLTPDTEWYNNPISWPSWRNTDILAPSTSSHYPLYDTDSLPSANLNLGVFNLHTPYDSNTPHNNYLHNGVMQFEPGWEGYGSDIHNGDYTTIVFDSPLPTATSLFGLS